MTVSHVAEVKLEELERALEGEVVKPADRGWDAARRAWNLAVDQHPAAVVFPTGADDVADAIAFARGAGLGIAVQSTGHGASSRGPIHDALLLNMARLDGFEIDPVTRTARAQAGAVLGPLLQAADDYGLAALAGTSPSVGVVGYSLGGGLGWLSRRYGLQANSVTAFELVTADGELVRADREHETDLFWALRGGGGNFGVVTAIEFALHPVRAVYAGALLWPVALAAPVVQRYREWVETVPDELTSLVRLLNLPPLPDIPQPLRGHSFVAVEAAYAGPEEDAVALLRPITEIGEPSISTMCRMRPSELTTVHMDPKQPVPGLVHHTMLREMTAETVDALLEVAGPGSATPLVSVELRHLGGAVAARKPGSGALAALDGRFAVAGVGIPTSPEVAAAVDRELDVLVETLGPWSTGGNFLNFADRPTDTETAFPADTYRRLARIREAVDPADLFRANHPIRS